MPSSFVGGDLRRTRDGTLEKAERRLFGTGKRYALGRGRDNARFGDRDAGRDAAAVGQQTHGRTQTFMVSQMGRSRENERMGKKVVWILGAGFSKALGGPLLKELFTPKSAGDLRVQFELKDRFPKLFDGPAKCVRWLYGHGTDVEPLWSNPEEFVDYLDTASVSRSTEGPHPQFDRLVDVLLRSNLPRPGATPPDEIATYIGNLSTAARRLIAAECSAFLEGVDVRQERWRPFRRWALSLTPEDTIVSFNYDLVLEKLGRWRTERAPGVVSPIHVVHPCHNLDPKQFEGATRILKLHGSVDWKKTKKSVQLAGGETITRVTVTVGKDEWHALDCADEELAIATPGPSKELESLEFESIWGLAMVAIRAADVVALLGYSFPATDAFAKTVLLDAIGGNKAVLGEAPHGAPIYTLSAHAVLGPIGDASNRVEALLNFVGNRRTEERHPGIVGWFQARQHPLLAQDFLTVFQREDL
jgi:hypothetical protein